MSQPKVFGPDERDPLDKPLTDINALIGIFHSAERPKEDWLIGIEYEMFGQINEGLSPIPYVGDVSITSLFQHLVLKSKNSLDPFLPILEKDHIVALSCKRAIIALEPGGQIEIAARPHHQLLDATRIFTEVVHDIREGARDLSIELFSLGIHPFASREDMAKVDKARYTIMRRYMGGLLGHGLDMMTRSCAIQLNLDYCNEHDMVEKMRLAAVLVPFYSLLCASSAFIDGKIAPYAIERGHVWRTTDPDRTGIPAIIFDDNFGYETYIQMVLDVPMYFLRRGQVYHNMAGASFRQFINNGLDGYHATERDFVDHMTTVFTEVRLKPILELRSADSLPLPFVNALTAFTWAIFYNDKARNKVYEIFDGITHQELIAFRNDVIDTGRKAQFRGQAVYEIAKKLLTIAAETLDESELLTPLSSLVEKNITCAEWIKERFVKLDKENLPKLIREFEPFNNPIANETLLRT